MRLDGLERLLPGWQEIPQPIEWALDEEVDTLYVDRDGYSTMSAVVRPDFNGLPTATVFYNGQAVLMVEGEGYEYDQPVWTEFTRHAIHACWLAEVGEYQHESPYTSVTLEEYVGQHGLFDDRVDELFGCDDGHSLVAFVGLVAQNMHAAYPDQTRDPADVGF